ncbi:MAG: site-specific integrase [Armatimonadota bacterium]
MLPNVDFENPQTPLESTIASARHGMVSKKYPYHSIYEATRIWRHLLVFAGERSIDRFSTELATDYLTYCLANNSARGCCWKTANRYLRILTEYHIHGTWERNPRRSKTPLITSPVLAGGLEQFILYWKHERHASYNTTTYGRRYLTDFLLLLEKRGICDWSGLDGSVFEAFFAARTHMKPRSMDLISCVLRLFVRFLFREGIAESNWASYIPRFRGFRNEKLPKTWTSDEVELLLSMVDRASPVGKRDYAILLLACRLGMRPSDITSLTLDNLRWDDARIDFTQTKTGKKVMLPLTEDVGEAIIDYLRNARPVSEHREVFLYVCSPYAPLGTENRLHGIISKYRRKAEMPIVEGVSQGMRSLRHNLATRLQQANVPLETIADILGHTSLETTRIYARVDISALRSVALNPEEVCDVHRC